MLNRLDGCKEKLRRGKISAAARSRQNGSASENEEDAQMQYVQIRLEAEIRLLERSLKEAERQFVIRNLKTPPQRGSSNA